MKTFKLLEKDASSERKNFELLPIFVFDISHDEDIRTFGKSESQRKIKKMFSHYLSYTVNEVD